MFRTGLLVSTAMTAVTLLLSGAPAQSQTDMHVADRDANARFLCTFGNFPVYSRYYDYHSFYFSSTWQHVAVPVIGHGQTVSRIRVIVARGGSNSLSAFSAGIYGTTASELPGKPIAVGKGKIGPSCGPVKVSIPRTTLKRKQKYWIEERTPVAKSCYIFSSSCQSFSNVYWKADPNTKRKAYVQHHHFESSSGQQYSSTTPWTEQASGPYFKLK